ncbi:tail fiber assembly protein [Achromobacter insuavis]|uniref:tail fiber assembly protein n=1 Tax=Achromobacter insuavis TaxID=1287735 RepID=UPI0009FF3FFC|nr:tail fiber assembly protein [Achromobacter insuavis]
MEKIVSQLDAEGFFLGPAIAYPSPLEPGVFHIPGGSVDVLPPASIEPGKRFSFENGQWVPHVLPVASQVEPPSREERVAAAIASRDALLAQAALRIDPLNDAVQLGIATEKEHTALAAWRLYRVNVARIDVEADLQTWPSKPDYQ